MFRPRRSYRPADSLVVSGAGNELVAQPIGSGAQAAPGLAVYRFGASLYYANTNRFSEEVRGIVTEAAPPLTWLCLDAAAISDVDYSAAEVLREMQVELGKQGVRVSFADVQGPVRKELDRYGITELVGADAYFATVADAIAAHSRTGSR